MASRGRAVWLFATSSDWQSTVCPIDARCQSHAFHARCAAEGVLYRGFPTLPHIVPASPSRVSQKTLQRTSCAERRSSMTVEEIALKKWKAVCPRCSHVECSQSAGDRNCDNCGAAACIFYGRAPRGDQFEEQWKSEAARLSWRRIKCSKGCGWAVSRVNCSRCGAVIQGAFFQGLEDGQCFIATACFEDTGHPTVRRLRRFRDHRLSQSVLGRGLIAVYWRVGPCLAGAVTRLPWLKAVGRGMLNVVAKGLSDRPHGDGSASDPRPPISRAP